MADVIPDLYSLILVLTPTAEATVRATVGHQAQAAFLRTMQEADPALAEALHAPDIPLRPYTVSPLLGIPAARNGVVHLAAGREYYLRFTVLHPLLYQRFMGRFLHSDARPLLRLGQAQLLIKEIRTTPGSHPWAGYSAWDQLAAAAQPLTEVTLAFASPTAFGFGQKEWGKKAVVLPQPELVFGSLARSWNGLAPAPLQLDRQALATYLEEHAVIKQFAGLRTRMFHYQKSPQVGFTGTVTYGLMGENDIARLQLSMLADFAFYAGVGMKTTQGMGQCRRLRTGAITRGGDE